MPSREAERADRPAEVSFNGWAYASASRRGSVHGAGEDGQDRFAVMVSGRKLVAAVSDGAGSASHGALGADTAARAFLEGVDVLGPRTVSAGRSKVEAFVQNVRDAVEQAALREGVPLQSCHCTLVGVVASPSGCLVVQIGDGAAVVEVDEGYTVPVAPLKSEHVNETVFLTSPDAVSKMKVARTRARISSVTLLTDGLQDCVVSRTDDRPHAPFFRSVTDRLSSLRGRDQEASLWLESVLASNPVVSRTDDDTCLVVARAVP